MIVFPIFLNSFHPIHLPFRLSALSPSAHAEATLGLLLSVTTTEGEATVTAERVAALATLVSTVTALASVAATLLVITTVVVVITALVVVLVSTVVVASIATVVTTVVSVVVTVLVVIVVIVVVVVTSIVVVATVVLTSLAIVTLVRIRSGNRRTSKSNGRSLGSESRSNNSSAEKSVNSSLVLSSLVRTGVLVSLDRVLKVLLVLENLIVDTLQGLGGLDGLGSVGLLVGIGLLDGEAATERTGEGVVAASNGADVSGGGTEAVKVIGHLDGDVESLGLDLRKTVCAGDVVGDGQVLDVGVGVAALVEITNIRTSTVGVDLVDGNSEFTTSLNLSNLVGRDSVLSVLTNIDVTRDLSTTTLVHNVGSDLGITNDGSVLLARVDSDAVASNFGVNLESHTVGRSVETLSTEDDRVSLCQGEKRRRKEKREGMHLEKGCNVNVPAQKKVFKEKVKHKKKRSPGSLKERKRS